MALVKVAEPALVPNVPLPMLLMSMTVPAGIAPVAVQAIVLSALLPVAKAEPFQLLSVKLMTVLRDVGQGDKGQIIVAVTVETGEGDRTSGKGHSKFSSSKGARRCRLMEC